MSDRRAQWLKHLDACIADSGDAGAIQAILKRLQRCCRAVEEGHNLADVLREPANRRSIEQAFGAPGDVGMQLLLRVALGTYAVKTFTTAASIEGARKLAFLHGALGRWREFDAVLSLQFAGLGGRPAFHLLNPLDRSAWLAVDAIPAGALVSAYLRTAGGPRDASRERTALERIRSDFEKAQSDVGLKDVAPGKAPVARRPKAPLSPASAAGRELSFRLEITVNKLDTFIHAGNAHLISSHVSDYPGHVKMFVLRGSRIQVLIDADTIWGLEIRNGESLLYEFYGPMPSEAYLKELAHRTNRYTQMDKVANE